MVILGSVIGAGFASGKEIVAFFGRNGFFAIPFLFVSAILFFCLFFTLSKLGKSVQPNSISDLTSAVFGKAGIAVDFGFIICLFITLSSMLAGSDSIGNLVFGSGYNFCYISIITAILTVLIISNGIKYIYKTTNIILPIMITCIVLILFVFLFGGNFENLSSTNINFSFFDAMIYSVLYASMNTFTNVFIISKSSENMSKKQRIVASVLSSTVILILIVLIFVSILLGGNEIFLSDMPMVSIAFSINQFFGIGYSFVLWIAIFTTICIASYTIMEWLFQFVKNKFLCSVIVLSVGFVFSRFGFSTIVSIFYPIEGVFGAIILLYFTIYVLKNKKTGQTIYSNNKNNFVKSTVDNKKDDIYSLKIEKQNGQIVVTKKKRGGQVLKETKKI